MNKQRVLEYLEQHPDQTNKREIARALGVKGSGRVALRQILKQLEADGAVARTGKRAFTSTETPPTTTVVQFESIDEHGELIGRAQGQEGLYGPNIVYAGFTGKRSGSAPARLDRALCRVEKDKNDVWHARVIKVFDAAPKLSVVGLFEANKYGGRVTPASRKNKHEYLIESSDVKDADDGDIVRIVPKNSKRDGPQRARIVEILGRMDEPRAASILALHSHDVPDEFSDSVLRDAENAKAIQTTREDLTHLPLLTIDPEDARDHDDAVCAWPDEDPTNKNGWVVIVAIADVAAFVRNNTPLDNEAYRRGNSTYFPDRVAPMLPETLSADQCSLRENELRETLAVEMRFSASGDKIGHRFIRGRMKSHAKLSYRQAQDAIDGNPDEKAAPLLETAIKPLWDAWHCVNKARSKREPLDLDLPERRITMSAVGAITGVALKERFDAHKLIEEFMIQANVCAAETLEEKRSPLIYRIHEEPSDEKIAALGNFLPTVGLKWTKGQTKTAGRFNALLEQARNNDMEYPVSVIVLRSQSQARYAHQNLGHFGLNLTRYAHFTSPIRRYSDLIVHRALIRALNLGPDGLTDEELVRLEEISEHLTLTERRSMAAERDAADRYLAAFMADKVGAEFEGRISGVTSAGLFVRLDETGADGFIPAAHLEGDFWIHDEDHSALVGERSQKRYEMSAPVQVRLKEATPLTGGLLFEMLTDPVPARKDLGQVSRPARTHRRGNSNRFKSGKQGRPKNVRLSKKKR
ncbi:MAG: ribonuclease R [Hirschia sp.]|nr:ribonuclease R [Hirschia sp.]MBF17188.1 ribonuclease R [Hirschia sp.]